MAALNHTPLGSRNGLSSGAGRGYGGEQRTLPVGSCNFRELSIGARAPTCGCTRFWLNRHNFSNHEDNSFCFCGHHACFHDVSDRTEQPQGHTDAVAVLGISGTPRLASDTETNNIPKQSRRALTPELNPTGLGIRPDPAQQPSSINVRVWEALNAFARDQEYESGVGNTPKLASTAAPSVADEARYTPTRVFPGRSEQGRVMGPPVDIPHGYNNAVTGCEEYSATEVATPSIAGTPDFRALAVPRSLARESPSNIQPQRLTGTGERQAAVRQSVEVPTQLLQGHAAPVQPLSTIVGGLSQDIHHLLHSYNRRIETLESLSFSQRPIEEVQERLELFDGRLLDLEQWRGDHEHVRKQVSDDSPPPVEAMSSKRRRLLPAESRSFESDVSFDLNAAAHTEAAVMATLVANAETLPRIEALESRVAALEDLSPPTFAQPWQIEVVLLPWGRELRGIWFSSEESTQHSLRNSTQASEEWTGACSVPKLSFKSSASAAWTTESIQAWADEATDWLSPKACGPSGTVFHRLASRGLVRDITLTSSGSRHILSTISSSFSNSLKSQVGGRQPAGSNSHGLNEPFIPLRKVRKSSRLRFLSPAEMVTSTTWTAEFLDASVFMKVNDGQRRLYITTSESYKQQTGLAWSWPKIRQLPLFNATGEEQAAQATHAAIEACWSYNDRLDRATSAHTSFAGSQWSVRGHSGHGETETEEVIAISPSSHQVYEHKRTVSLPSSISAGDKVSPGLPKRRVASFETNATELLHTEPTAKITISKRRRVSISPEAERRGVGLTPRYSREPPSPFTTSDPAYEARSQATSSRKRGITPLAYASPHSNNNFATRVSGSLVGGDGDTEPDVDLQPVHQHESDKFEDEWNGVDDDMQASDDSVGGDDDDDDDDDAELDDEDVLDEDERLDMEDR
nr:hypothetical protein CFP56_19319 [Quercus suber]